MYLNFKLLDDNGLILISCCFAILFSFTLDLIFPVLLIFIISIIYFYNTKVILGIIIIAYLSAPTQYFGDSRVYINICATTLLLLLFIKEFGIHFERYPKVPKVIILFLVTLFICLIVSTIFSTDPYTGLITIITMSIFFIICYMFYSFLEDEKNIYIYIYSICISSLILTIRMFFDLYFLGFQDFAIRSLLEEKIELYGSAGYTGAIILFISISFITSMFFFNKFKGGFKFLISIFFIINLMAIILANARAIIISALLSIFFIIILLRRALIKKIIFIASIGIVILLFTFPDNISSIYFRTDTTHREIFWDAGINVIKDYPVVGIGPNMFDKYFYSYASSSIFTIHGWRVGKHTPHNLFIYYLAENGVLGFFIAISFFVLFFYIGIRTIRITKESNKTISF